MPPRRAQLARIVRWCGPHQRTRRAPIRRTAMCAIGPPRRRLARASRQQQDQPAPPRDLAHPFEQGPPILTSVMAEYHPAPARQTAKRGPQRVAHPFVGHQPQARERLARAHRHPYSAAMLPTEDDPAARLAAVREKLARAAALAGRKADAIELIAISKTHPVEAIEPLIEAGQRSFGENRVQEAQGKWPALKAAYPDIRLHLVGQLQSNKTAEAVALFDAIHSLDRPSLAEALARAIDKAGRTPTLFVQVNIGAEEQKGGCAIADLPALLALCRDLGLAVAGLMCVPPADTEAAPYFALLAKLAKANGLSELSMGMSGDYETAAMLGATCVRVGSALFGAREDHTTLARPLGFGSRPNRPA